MVFRSAAAGRRTGLMLTGIGLLAFAVGFVAMLISAAPADAPQIVVVPMPAEEAPIAKEAALEEVAVEEVAVEEVAVEEAVPSEERNGGIEEIPEHELVVTAPVSSSSGSERSRRTLAKKTSREDREEDGTISESETLNPF